MTLSDNGFELEDFKEEYDDSNDHNNTPCGIYTLNNCPFGYSDCENCLEYLQKDF